MLVRFSNGRESEVRDEIALRMARKGQCTIVERNVTPEEPAQHELVRAAPAVTPPPMKISAKAPAKARRR